MKKYLTDAVAILVLCLVPCILFFHLFIPTLRIPTTPDFGRNDAWDFSFATKYILAQSIHAHLLPLWSSSMGGGFPLYAEGQTGTWYIPNLLLYSLFSPIVAYNASIIFVFITAGIGMYVLLRVLSFGCMPALFGSITLQLSGLLMVQLTHITLLQGFCLIPLLFALYILLTRSPTLFRIGICAFVTAQQILSGFPQAAFVTFAFVVPLSIVTIFRSSDRVKKGLSLLCAMALGIGISAIQLVPSYEFLKRSTSPKGFTQEVASYFAYPFAHLQTLIAPFALGNPKYGTYPPFSRFNGSIFWENTAYVGIFPLFLAVIALLYALRSANEKNKRIVVAWSIGLLIAGTLMLGGHSPLYFLYSLWPFTLFRVPSRFIWIALLALLVLATYGFQTLWRVSKKRSPIRAMLLILFFAHIGHLWYTWSSYNMYSDAKSWMNPPIFSKHLGDTSKLLTIGSETLHNKTFLTTGWRNSEFYTFMRNAIAPNTNVYAGITTQNVYAGRFLARPSIIDGLLVSTYQQSETELSIPPVGQTLLKLQGVTHLITEYPVKEHIGTVIDHIQYHDDSLYLTKLNSTVPFARVVYSTVLADTVEAAQTVLLTPTFDPVTTAIVETQDRVLKDTKQVESPNITINRPRDTQINLSIENNTSEGILILSQTYYPGWKAYIGDRETPIFPVNLSQQGIVLPKGTHTVTVSFVPESLQTGMTISLISLLLTILAVGSRGFFRGGYTHRTAR